MPVGLATITWPMGVSPVPGQCQAGHMSDSSMELAKYRGADRCRHWTRLDEMKRVHIHLVIIITKLSSGKFSFNF